MRAANTDKNQRSIVKHFRDLGASVTHLHSVGKGVPDLIVGYNGVNYMVEVKSSRGTLNKMQVDYFNNWNGQICVIRTNKEVEELLGLKGL